jgi:peptidoglycan/xylan/chitin deacetylase (PgdA/CDA1 family)
MTELKERERPPFATRFAELRPFHSLRSTLRNAVTWAQSRSLRIPTDREWVFFPFYHHVLDDERRGFERHIKYFRNFGDIISLDEAVALLTNPAGIGGRYFCITFDDGYKTCFSNALPILIAQRCVAAFFLPTDYIGLDPDKDWPRLARYPYPYRLPMEFMNWDECLQLNDAGMTIGAHTCSHPRLTEISEQEMTRELRDSKRIVEERLRAPCDHFACPFGAPGSDFTQETHPGIARELGFKTFLTTAKGVNASGTSPWAIRRVHYYGCHGTSILRSEFCRSSESNGSS